MNMMDFQIPMEPKLTSQIPQGEEWVGQVKWDGVRLLAHISAGEIVLWNRKGRNRTLHYPELHRVTEYVGEHSVVLDGEMIALGNDGKPSFHQVMKRDGLKRMDKVALVCTRVPIVYMVFDILFYDGAWCTHLPFTDRAKLLEELLCPTSYIQRVTSESPEVLYTVTAAHGLEGMVVKRRSAPYHFGQKSNDWLKIKHISDEIFVIGGFTRNDAGMVNSLFIGLYNDNEELVYISNVGIGRLSHAEWRVLTAALEAQQRPHSPFVNLPPKRVGQTVWVEPQRTVKVQYLEWLAGRGLRQPSIQALMETHPLHCRMPNLENIESEP
jgi:bifunctional non-homologous end joining protein LigD